MGARYLVLAGGGADPGRLRRARQRLEAAHWRETIAGAGLSLWTRADRPIAMCSLAGGLFVVGEIGRRPGRATAPPPQSFEALIGDWCGGYLAVRPTPTGFELLRDPTGAMDVLAWRSGGLVCVANDLQGTPEGLQPDEAALDWDVIAGFFRDPVSVWGPSAFAGVRAVAPGEVLAVDATACASRAASLGLHP
jgi:asparagine synthase (glutamine-hydrolysing)